MIAIYEIDLKYFWFAVARLLATLAFIAMSATTTIAALPAHEPGTICATPEFWCWAQLRGIYGQPCTCPTAAGYVSGVYV
jgi:hypothetical protein